MDARALEDAAAGLADYVGSMMRAGADGRFIVKTLIFVAGATTYAWTEGRDKPQLSPKEIGELVGDNFVRGYETGPEANYLFPPVEREWEE